MKLATETEACEHYKISRSLLRNLIARGMLRPPIKLGRVIRHDMDGLEEDLRKLQAAARPTAT